MKETQSKISDAEAQELMRSLLHKEGTWVEWGKACQQLQQGGYDPKNIFEVTGFQVSQQNLVIVAAQVYDSLVEAQLEPSVLEYFKGPRSDVLYEFRILNKQKRATASQLAYEKRLDIDGAHLVAKAIQDVAYMSQIPDAFTDCPGDNVAYLCWKRARHKKDLQQRSRLIAQGLKFAHSATARDAIEQLLSDFTVVSSLNAPLLPIHRLEVEEALPRIVPLVGSYPIDRSTLEAAEKVKIQQLFSSITVSNGTFVPVPGWQTVLKAVDPVAYLCPSDRLPKSIAGKVEQMLVIIDRACQQWDVNSYFAIETEEKTVELKWFETAPTTPIIGQLVLILRPKKILDENNITEPWQMDD
ncbi:MAG: hypothetical protein Tsb0014_15120 [Pleurocapsa sp.]